MNRTLLYLLVGWLTWPLSSPAAVAAVDPFYRERMEAGVRALEQGDWHEAARQIRIACFGYLEEPVALVGGLTRLATAQAAVNDRSGFVNTFSRIALLEERFSAYSEADVSSDLREAFEEAAARLIPLKTLSSSAAFESVAERGERRQWVRQPPERRRAELESRLEQDPDNEQWIVEMARLELEKRRPRRALDWLDRLPVDAAQRRRASCLRQQAATESDDCGRMDLTQPFCANAPVSLMEFRLVCLVGERRWTDAAALLEQLPAESRASRRIVRLQQTIERQQANQEEEGERTPEADPELPAGPVAPPAVGIGPPAVPKPTEDPVELAALRQSLSTAETRDDLRALLGQATDLAGARPESRAAQLLTAEVAYLLSDWPLAVTYFRRAGGPDAEEVRPSFYFAVALYETGELTTAADVLQPVVQRLERTRFVQDYVERILALDDEPRGEPR